MTAIGDQATHGPIECSARGEEHDGCGDSRLRKACAVARAVVLRLERRRWSSCCRRCDEQRDVCRDGTADGVAHNAMYSEMHYCCQRRGDPGHLLAGAEGRGRTYVILPGCHSCSLTRQSIAMGRSSTNELRYVLGGKVQNQSAAN